MLPLECATKNCAPPDRGTQATAQQRLPSCTPLSLSVAAITGLLEPAACCSCARRDMRCTARRVANRGRPGQGNLVRRAGWRTAMAADSAGSCQLPMRSRPRQERPPQSAAAAPTGHSPPRGRAALPPVPLPLAARRATKALQLLRSPASLQTPQPCRRPRCRGPHRRRNPRTLAVGDANQQVVAVPGLHKRVHAWVAVAYRGRVENEGPQRILRAEPAHARAQGQQRRRLVAAAGVRQRRRAPGLSERTLAACAAGVLSARRPHGAPTAAAVCRGGQVTAAWGQRPPPARSRQSASCY